MGTRRSGRWTPVAAAVAAAAAMLMGAEARAFDFTFTGQCDDCAFAGAPGDPEFDPFGDGLFETVTGTLTLSDVSTNPQGRIEVDGSNFVSFTYHGSSLLNPFTFTDPYLVRGELSPAGAIQPGEPLRIETSQGDFSSFCTALGVLVLAEDGVVCGSVGLAFFELDASGAWSVSGSEPFDTGNDGQLAPAVPEPGAAASLALGPLGAGLLRCRRRRATARG